MIERLYYHDDYQKFSTEDRTVEQNYHRNMRLRHNNALHCWGRVFGLEVSAPTATQITILQGMAIDGAGQEIVVESTADRCIERTFPVGTSETLENYPEGGTFYLAIAYKEESNKALARTTEQYDVRLYVADEQEPWDDPSRILLAKLTLAKQDSTGALSIQLPVDTSVVTEAGAKIANNTIVESKLDAAARGKLVIKGNAHTHSGSDGARLNHSALTLDGGTNPHGTTAADVGALPTAGGRVDGTLSARSLGAESLIIGNELIVLRGSMSVAKGDVIVQDGQMTIYSRNQRGFASVCTSSSQGDYSTRWADAAIIGVTNDESIMGIYAGAGKTNAFALYVQGQTLITGIATFCGAKTGYVVDTFINASGDKLHTGNVVKLRGTPIPRFEGNNNKIPIPEVILADKENDARVIGIVDREAIPTHGSPDTRVDPDDPTFIADGGTLYVVTLGTYAHCKVDATESPIEVGDLLTSSSNPGHAKKATDPKIGCIIGKALEPLQEGTGYIAVFVNIQ